MRAGFRHKALAVQGARPAGSPRSTRVEAGRVRPRLRRGRRRRLVISNLESRCRGHEIGNPSIRQKWDFWFILIDVT